MRTARRCVPPVRYNPIAVSEQLLSVCLSACLSVWAGILNLRLATFLLLSILVGSFVFPAAMKKMKAMNEMKAMRAMQYKKEQRKGYTINVFLPFFFSN